MVTKLNVKVSQHKEIKFLTGLPVLFFITILAFTFLTNF